jgi:ABC-type uncharacterized transport system auxiliary subunit
VKHEPPAARAHYEIDLDIRAFELDAETKEAHIDVAARIVALGSRRIAADQSSPTARPSPPPPPRMSPPRSTTHLRP